MMEDKPIAPKKRNKEESFGFPLLAIAFSVFYILTTRIELIFTYYNILISLGDGSQVKGYFIISIILFFILILISIVFLFCFFKKKILTKYLFIYISLIYVLHPATSYLYGAYIVGVDVDFFELGYIDHLIFDTVVLLLVLLPYLFFSKKSKAVFTK
ncbi:hypothetical protein [Obesumbacterium proteus]|uniref:Uncharacterized protein n=1 Tax=Obesumbacterium proteus ATCC 12841 TaxID=1354268 RepID=A0AA91IMD0_9GAMM|nr:hypothetical protein [Obesumbacterium proteus]OAT56529.1 hypothetical protein M993_04784 [Obesumbacterium proteus ATCC 12841]